MATLGGSGFHNHALSGLLKQQERLLAPLGFTDRLTKNMFNPTFQSPFAEVFRAEQSAAEALASSLRPDPIDLISHRSYLPHIPEPHDAEAFYFRKWQSGIPVQKGIVTCDLWRHQEGKVSFEIHVLFATDGPRNGRVVCEVHAGNLMKPVSVSVAVRRDVEERLFSDDLKQMIKDT